jgi:YceI-like domain.
MSIKNILFASMCTAALFVPSVNADTWQLDSDNSVLNFVSVKNNHVAETHRFTDLQGTWNDNRVSIEIPVVSLDTQIPIRNERMLEHVFQSSEYSVVTATATLEDDVLMAMAVGESVPLAVELDVYIAGESETVSAYLQLTRLATDRFLATTTQPVIIDTKAFSLVAGVDKLREIAGLSRIDYSVPVTFSVQFTQ